MKREFSVKCGISIENDTYSSRFFSPLEKGGSKKNVPPLGDLLQMYYRKRNWNEKGIPNI